MVRVLVHNGKQYEFNYHSDAELVDLVFNEIFVDEDYREGLNYIKCFKHPIVVDIGAFIGITPLYFNQAKNATIYAIEPNPYSYQALDLNCRTHKNIFHFRTSIGYKTKKRELIIPKDKSIAMSFYGDSDEAFQVDSYSIDDFVESYQIEHINLLKIDVEGAEYEIFLSDGFKKIAPKIDMIIGEAHDLPLNHTVLPEILKMAGFKTKWKKDLNYISNTTYRLGDLEGTITTKLNTLFIAGR